MIQTPPPPPQTKQDASVKSKQKDENVCWDSGLDVTQNDAVLGCNGMIIDANQQITAS